MNILKIKDWKYLNSIKKQDEANSDRIKKIREAINSSRRIYYWSYRNDECLSYTQSDWNKTLLDKIHEANQDFGGNTIFASSEACAILSDMSDFIIDMEEGFRSSSFNKSGKISNFTVWAEAYLQAPIVVIVKEDFFTTENPDCAVIRIENITTF